ncbi:MAG TPA: hypothetical protein P5181_03715 [Dermatophilaceae bacterium]|nr:hypothetical protein [Dermatophilaceae bacterium]
MPLTVTGVVELVVGLELRPRPPIADKIPGTSVSPPMRRISTRQPRAAGLAGAAGGFACWARSVQVALRPRRAVLAVELDPEPPLRADAVFDDPPAPEDGGVVADGVGGGLAGGGVGGFCGIGGGAEAHGLAGLAGVAEGGAGRRPNGLRVGAGGGGGRARSGSEVTAAQGSPAPDRGSLPSSLICPPNTPRPSIALGKAP